MVLISKSGGLSGSDIASSEITDENLFCQRRKFLQLLTATGLAGVAGNSVWANSKCKVDIPNIADKLSSYSSITRYNNYYEFTTNKKMVVHIAKELSLKPWTIQIDGAVEKPITLGIEDLLKKFTQEERIYRLRCVEGWSMVVPWNGFSLCELIKLAKPSSDAKYVEFISLLRPEEMIGQRQGSLTWPYREALRIDEAMHPLTMLVTGLYGKELPAQNGAPLRLAVPWKYGFKSSKAITHIRFLKNQPQTSWSLAVPSEYGFYANVNPEVAHPRWDQRRETRLGELFKTETLPFNGYADQVASLYKGMDLKTYF
jgi:sulfoxide reductase catalytic subunit YedY